MIIYETFYTLTEVENEIKHLQDLNKDKHYRYIKDNNKYILVSD